jgi:hypothetical protein
VNGNQSSTPEVLTTEGVAQNPWREFIENTIGGKNYFRTGDYFRLLKDLDRLYRIEAAAERLLSLVEEKGQPRDGPENQRLLTAGDTIAVNEGNLWALLAEVKS